MAAGDPVEIGLVLYPGVQSAAVHGLTDIFAIASRLAAPYRDTRSPALRTTHWRFQDPVGPPACVHDSHAGPPARPAVIIVPLTLVERPEPALMARVADWLRDRHADGACLGSVCSGLFILAETGLLAGRTASTHWSCADELAARFPDIRLEQDSRVIDHGDVITAGGFMAWIDLGLRLVDRLVGPMAAAETARFLMVDTEPQRQRRLNGFSPRLSHGDEAILRAQHWLHGRDARNVSLSAMAEQARLEPRTFLRRFASATGLTPMDYCRRVRIARARELLEFSNKPLKEIAWATGFDDAGAFGKAFRRLAGISPSDYRRQVARN